MKNCDHGFLDSNPIEDDPIPASPRLLDRAGDIGIFGNGLASLISIVFNSIEVPLSVGPLSGSCSGLFGYGPTSVSGPHWIAMGRSVWSVHELRRCRQRPDPIIGKPRRAFKCQSGPTCKYGPLKKLSPAHRNPGSTMWHIWPIHVWSDKGHWG